MLSLSVHFTCYALVYAIIKYFDLSHEMQMAKIDEDWRKILGEMGKMK